MSSLAQCTPLTSNEKVNCKSITTGVLVLALVVGVTSTTALAVLQAPNRPAPKSASSQATKSDSTESRSSGLAVQRVNVLCLDADGKPVAGAEVHLFQQAGGDGGAYLQFGPVTSDAQGKAICAEAIYTNELGNFDRWIYSRIPGRLVGVGRCAKWTNQRVINPEGRVAMHASRSIEGQVNVPAGFDPTKVTVRVQTLHISTGAGDFDYESFPRYEPFRGLDTALPKIFESSPDSEGRIRFSDVPVRGNLYLVTAGDGLGEAQWSNDKKTFDQLIQLTIEEESLLSGRVVTPDRKPAVGMKVTARLSPFGRRQNSHLTSFRAVTDVNGKYVIHGLPQTEFVLSVEDPKKLWTFRPLENLLVEPHKDPVLIMNMQTGVLVSGRVFDADGKPVLAASCSAIADSRDGPGLSHDFTDGSGRYQFRLPSGGAKLYFDALPEGFAYPQPQIVKHLDIQPGQADVQNLDFTIQRQSPMDH
jgi:hypothetical protein